MAEKEFFINDRLIIPDEIKSMTKEQRLAEIARFEKEAAAEKQRILNRHGG